MGERGPKGRRFSAAEKLKIIEEARAPGTSVAEVLRRYQVDGTSFYLWEKKAKAGMLEALGGARQNGSGEGKDRSRDRDRERKIERLEAELDRKSRIIAEVVEENLALKKGL